jgi:hypothetical protein
VASIDSALVFIDPDTRVTAELVAAGQRSGARHGRGGRQRRHPLRLPGRAGQSRRPGDVVDHVHRDLRKIITVYTSGNPGGTFTAGNSCPAGAPNVNTTATGLKAQLSGWNQ